jgi:Zn-dependent protease with chaperone function
VCPRCGSLANSHEFCSGCGLRVAVLPELPTRAEWEARGPVAEIQMPPEPAVVPSVAPLLHPGERPRLVLAVAASVVAIGLLGRLFLAAHAAAFLLQLLGILVFAFGSLWITQQVLRARLLGRSVKVDADTMPELQAVLDDVRSILHYTRSVDVYVIDKAKRPIVMTSYLGTRIILLEGDLVAELLAPGKRPQLTFLLGRSIGALRAQHTRVDLLVYLLQAVDALKFAKPLILPYYRATTYSGDQIGMMCSGDYDAVLEATRRLLVGGRLAAEVPAGAVLRQACLVQRRLLPRIAQLFSPEPHITNRYANLLCFGRYHDPELATRIQRTLDVHQLGELELLWQHSPYRRRVEKLGP